MKYSLLRGVNGLGEHVGKVVDEKGSSVYLHPHRGIEHTLRGWEDIDIANRAFKSIKEYVRKQEEERRLAALRREVSFITTVQEVEWI